MITVKGVPNIFSSKGRWESVFDFVPGKPVRDYLRDVGITPDVVGQRIVVTDQPSLHLDSPLQDGFEIIVTHELGGPLIPALVAAASSIGAWIAANTVQAVLLATTIGYSIYQATQKPKAPSFNLATGNFQDSSPTYGWDGIQMLQGDVNVPVAVGYGRHRVGGNLINSYIRADGEKQYLHLLIGLCEGPVQSITNVRLNDNPIENFSDVEVVTKLGTNDQTPIPYFEELHQNYSVSAQVTKASPYTYTTVDNAVEAFEVHLKFPNGVYSLNSSGGVDSAEMIYQIEYKEHSAGSWTDLGNFTVSEKSRTDVTRIFRKEGLTPGQYDIRVTRVSDDPTFTYVTDLWLDKVDEITTDDLAYPNTALLAIRALATEQLSGSVPNVTCEVEFLLIDVPDVRTADSNADPVDWEDYYWDPDAEAYKLLADGTELDWDGETFVKAWSANPVWSFRDILINNRYGLGDYIDTSLIPIETYIEMSQYCEEKVPVVDSNGSTYYEKRMRLDCVIDGLSAALDLLVQLAAVFRGMPFYSKGQIQLYMDKPEDPVQLFGMGNVVKDSFSQKWASQKEKFNVITISFLDKDQNYVQDTAEYGDEPALQAGEPRRPKSLTLLTTYRSQAIREARYALRVAKYIDRMINFKAGIDAIVCRAGQVVRFSHDVPQYGFSGRVKAGSDTTHIVLDQEVTIEAGKSYLVYVRHQDDTVEEKVIISGAGIYSTLEVFSAFDQVPAEYETYAFGESTKAMLPVRIAGVSREGTHEVGLVCAEYDENVYDDSEVFLPKNNSSMLTLGVPDVVNLKLTERLVKLGDGTIEDVIDVWWQKPDLSNYNPRQFVQAHIYLSDNAGASWVHKGSTNGISFSIQGGIQDGASYRVAVVSSDEFGKENAVSLSPYQDLTVIGKSAQPSDVTTFLVNQSRDRLYFGWSEVADVDLAGYEIRRGNSWESGTVLISGVRGNNHIALYFSEGENQKYYIKAIDTSGNYSETATEAVLTVDNIPFTNIIQSFEEYPDWTGTCDDTHANSSGDLKIDTGLLSGTYETPVRDMGYVANFKIGISSVVVIPDADTAFDSDPDATFADDSSRRFSGLEIAGATSFEIRTSEDNITWTSYIPWQSGDYRCRYFQIRMTVTRATPEIDLSVQGFAYYSDLPDVDEFGTASVTVAANGADIVFEKTYHEEPAVNVTIKSGNGIYHRVSNNDITGRTIKLYDASGVAQTGDFEYHVHGI